MKTFVKSLLCFRLCARTREFRDDSWSLFKGVSVDALQIHPADVYLSKAAHLALGEGEQAMRERRMRAKVTGGTHDTEVFRLGPAHTTVRSWKDANYDLVRVSLYDGSLVAE